MNNYFVLVNLFILCSNFYLSLGSPKKTCPDKGDISPCLCLYDEKQDTLTMDCSAVTSEDELERVFTADFPSKHFEMFFMEMNNYVKVLRNNVFNQVTFVKYWVYYGVLESIEDEALEGNDEDYVTDLEFHDNNIQVFNFQSLDNFGSLRYIGFNHNSLTTWQPMESPDLKILELGFNPFGDLPANALQNLPALEWIHLEKCGLTYLNGGTFSNLNHLVHVDLYGNQLRKIFSNTFNSISPNFTGIYLHDNLIDYVEPGAFTVDSLKTVSMHDNLMETLDEATWKPLADNDVWLSMEGNPLLCLCDIAWLVKNPELLDNISTLTTCRDGRKVHDLNPDDYNGC
ncbi:unnamed protein product [Meganyctiphanes norvegica]|uniref:Uncharacterized protein n=1 Tax=Meganyctiphanes norvegica TaxID=48144 RepID=A0AAV2SC66_MEGNR